MNDILQKQNLPVNLDYLKASSVLYSRAKVAFGIQIVVTVILTITFSFLKLIPKENLGFELNAFLGIASILIVFADILFFNFYVSGLRTSGAKAQEKFDCTLYELPWNKINSGSELESYIIRESVSEYKPDPKSPIENWYDINLEGLSKERAILLCQETNLFYDGKLREHFKMANILTCISIFVISLVISLIAGNKVSEYITVVLVPVLPMISLTLKIIVENKKSLTVSADLKKTVLQLKAREGDPSMEELRGIQDKIYCNRKDSTLVPNWYYKWRRKKLEKIMKFNASN
ncbi:S-4TM family putative pore-forming effector [Flavobacterium sp. RHBU_3]|uniref:S-4TM family putative pore-forming effector n=1 Tax=Flavobacterium sp. RHBU_3 TaxID=3391184 RepID=UPI0039848D2B